MEELPTKSKFPKFDPVKFASRLFNRVKAPGSNLGKTFCLIVSVIIISSFFGFAGGLISSDYLAPQLKDYFSKIVTSVPATNNNQTAPVYIPQTTEEKSVIDVVKETSPSVVSIIVTKDLPVIEQYYINPFPDSPFDFQIPQFRQKGVQKQEVGGGTGFIISEDGMILTNEHVVTDKEADYTVLTNDGKKYPAEVLARDTARDLAVIKIVKEDKSSSSTFAAARVKEDGTSFPILNLGNSDNLQIGQTIIAIGNALGEFRNTVSVGVISGLGRTVAAGGGGVVETLEDVIQTDAAINRGNSGGPLLNLKGEVIGVNFAMAQGAENIGFAIPINRAKKGIEQVKTLGKIVYPFLGVRYALINDATQQENKLPVNYGALVTKGSQGEPAIFPGSPAEAAGLKEGDIILEFNGEKITIDNSLAKTIGEYNPGDKVTLKILRGSEEKIIEITLGEKSE